MAIFNANRAASLIFSLGKLANRSGKPGTVAQAVVDGDTLRVLLPGAQGLRFLACDTPEKTIELPVRRAADAAAPGRKSAPSFVPLDDARWDEFLNSVFDGAKWGAFNPPLPAALVRHLEGRIKKDAARNQWDHATAATDGLRKLIAADRDARGADDGSLAFFIAYSHEVLDRYGRPLVFVNIDEKAKEKRPEIYNVRMIAEGFAAPLFIWPNIDPFREMKVTDAAMAPRKLRAMVARTGSLQRARKAAAEARGAGKGIYAPSPLQLQAFELRYLARRAAPDRWVIDLSADRDDDQIIPAAKYFAVPNMEDRLFIPPQYAPLFKERGWK